MFVVKNISKQYGSVTALINFDLNADKGDVIGLLGLNGAGKTTLLRIISGYISTDTGSITLDTISLTKDYDKYKALLGYLPENNPLYTYMTVEEFIRFSYNSFGRLVKRRKVNSKVADDLVKSTLTLLDINNKRNVLIKNLSKGYKQRVGIAAAIINKPQLLLLDEPTEGLDPVQRTEIRELIKAISKTTTLIISSHVLDEIKHMCNRVIILHKGKKSFDGPINSKINLDQIFLDVINEKLN